MADSLTVTASIVSLVVSIGSLAVAIASFIRSGRVERDQRELRLREKQVADLEIASRRRAEEQKRKADVRVSLVGSISLAHFVIQNRGPGRAKDITFDLEGGLDGPRSPLTQGESAKLPVRELPPGGTVKFLLGLSYGTGTEFNVSLSWINEDGSKGARAEGVSL